MKDEKTLDLLYGNINDATPASSRIIRSQSGVENISACSCSSKSSYEDKGRQEAKDELQCCCQKKDWIVLCDPDGDNIDDLTDSITEHSPPQLKEKGLYIWGSGAVNEDLV